MKKSEYSLYIISNSVNDKIYIGSTVYPVNIRFSQHKSTARAGSKAKLHRAMRKHGIDKFKIDQIAVVLNLKDLENEEHSLIMKLNVIKNGYNSIGILKGSRELIAKTMKKQWNNPIKKEQRVQAMIEGSQKKAKVAVDIQSGEVLFFQSEREAERITGVVHRSIMDSVMNSGSKGQGYVWFEYTTEDKDYYRNIALKSLGRFQTEYTRSVIARDINTGVETTYENLEAVRKAGFNIKALKRQIRNKGVHKGFLWRYEGYEEPIKEKSFSALDSSITHNVCKKCQQNLSVDNFTITTVENRQRYQATCKKCRSEIYKQRYHEKKNKYSIEVS